MDFLVDDVVMPSLMFINSDITKHGLIPEIGFIGSGQYQEEYDMYDKNNIKCCRIKLPFFLANQFVLIDQCFVSNTTEFKITKVYEEERN